MVGEMILEMVDYFEGDIAQINHTLKVYGYAKAIAAQEKASDNQQLIVELAALLHDIGIPESMRIYGSTAGNYQEIAGVPVAKKLLAKINCPWSVSEQVLFLVGHHHSLETDGGLPLQILFEADFLANLEEGNLSSSPNDIKSRFFLTDSGKRLMYALYHV